MSNITGEIDVDDVIEQLRNGKVPETQAATHSNTGVNDMVKKYVDNDENPPPQHQWDDDMPMGPGHHSADPFAPREGKTLVWKDVNMTLVRQRQRIDRASLFYEMFFRILRKLISDFSLLCTVSQKDRHKWRSRQKVIGRCLGRSSEAHDNCHNGVRI